MAWHYSSSLDLGAGAGRHPDADERATVGKRTDAVDQVLAADRIEDHVCAAPVGQFARSFDEVLLFVLSNHVGHDHRGALSPSKGELSLSGLRRTRGGSLVTPNVLG